MQESFSDRQRRDEEIRQTIAQKLIQSGEKERLKEYLRTKLIECGWRDEMKSICREVIRSKGIDQVTLEDLVQEISPRGKASIPDSIRAEMLEKIKVFIEKES